MKRQAVDFERIVEEVGDALGVLDCDWRFVYVNAPAERLLKRSRQELLGRAIWEEYPDLVGSGFYEKCHQAVYDGMAETCEERLPGLDRRLEIRCHPFENGLFVSFRDVTPRWEAEEKLREALHVQRRFLTDVLASVTEGRLRLCETADDLPAFGNPFGSAIRLSGSTLRLLRQRVREASSEAPLPEDRMHGLIAAVGESAMNAVVHAQGGEAQVYVDAETVQVWIMDRGSGIEFSQLPRATLQRGFTTAGSLGHGFYLILQSADRVYLLTGPTGTTVVLEQQRTPPVADWLRGIV